MNRRSVPIRPAATAMLLRDSDDHIEVLMLKRNKELVFAGGCWVFPGGRIDDEDYPERNCEDDGESDSRAKHRLAARHAAVRETAEETGLAIRAQDLIEFAHWTTPDRYPKRYATTYFTIHIPGDEPVRIDGSEIVDFAWMRPQEALQQHAQGKMPMLPPTVHTLRTLSEHRSIESYFRMLNSY